MLNNTQIHELTIFIKRQITSELNRKNININSLSKAIGTPPSTISQVLNANNTRLPSILTLIKIARVLGKPIDDLVPSHLINFDTFESPKSISFPPDGVFNWVQTLERILAYSHFKTIYYHPRNLPDFAKTNRMIQSELGISEDDATSYTTTISKMLQNKISGCVVIDEAALIDLMDRKQIYADISRHEAILCIEKLRAFANVESKDIQTVVCSRHVEAIDPIMIIGDQVAMSYCFGRLAIINDKNLIYSGIERFRELQVQHPSLAAWLASV